MTLCLFVLLLCIMHSDWKSRSIRHSSKKSEASKMGGEEEEEDTFDFGRPSSRLHLSGAAAAAAAGPTA